MAMQGSPTELVSAADLASEDAYANYLARARDENPRVSSIASLKQNGWLWGSRWAPGTLAAIEDGVLHVYANPKISVAKPIVTLPIQGCAVAVSELGACDGGQYCLALNSHCNCEPDEYSVKLCFDSSRLHMLWLAALKTLGAELEDKDTTTSQGIDGETNFFDFSANTLEGEPISFEKFRSNVCLVVNVASK